MDKLISKINNVKLSNWKNKRVSVVLDSSDIIITEPIHKSTKGVDFNGIMYKYQHKDIIDNVIIVRPYNGEYSLVMGIKWLIIAKLLNKPIECIIVGKNFKHKQLFERVGMIKDDYKYPIGTEDIIDIQSILIPKAFKRIKSRPARVKYEKYENYYKLNGVINKPISVKVIDNKIILTDQYVRYLILKTKGERHVPIKYATTIQK